MLIDPLDYQLTAVRKALSDDNLPPRILIADAVGLGKTLEIGMILSELIRRGRGECILVVTPKQPVHVLPPRDRLDGHAEEPEIPRAAKEGALGRVVIDEIHNATNVGTQNNELARTLAPTTEALLLASATPHNGDPESLWKRSSARQKQLGQSLDS